MKNIIEQVEDIPKDARIVSLDVMPHNPLSYVLRPRDTLFVRSEFLSQKQMFKAIDMFDAEYVISKGDVFMENIDNVKYINSLESKRFGSLSIYRVGGS